MVMKLKTADSIREFSSCVRRDILAYVRYPYTSGSRCFSKPQYVIEGGEIHPLSRSAFPDDGTLPMVMANTSVEEMKSKFGSIVVMTVNDEELRLNNNYPIDENARYNSIIDPSRKKGTSAVEFVKLGKHPLSSELMQVIEIEEHVDFSKPLKDPVRVCQGQGLPDTSLVAVSQLDAGKEKYYGPFEASVNADGGVTLRASDSYDMRIIALGADRIDLRLDLFDDEGDGFIYARFISSEEFLSKVHGAASSFDWIGDEELLDALGRIARTDDAGFTKGQTSKLKRAIRTCSEAVANLALDEVRRNRLVDLVGNYENWSSLPEETKRTAIESASPEQLAKYVLSDEHFTGFYEKVLEHDEVRDKVAQEKAKFEAKLDQLKMELRDKERQIDEREAELARLSSDADSMREMILADVQQEVDEAEYAKQLAFREISQAKDDLTKLQAEVEEKKKEKWRVEDKIRQVIEGMSNEMNVAGKILENEMIQQIVRSIGSASTADASPVAAAAALRGSMMAEADMSPAQVRDEIVRAVSEVGGRDLSANDVVNLMTCLSQGYVTTFAGLPGTGKTSLANILSGALGLSQKEARRFVEVPVERGWTSYKDFIGYYNPFTKELEKANVGAFDAFAALDAEARSGEAGKPPFVFILDEANLSSVEHYWSPFLRTCDSFRQGPASLSLGGDRELLVPDYVRFIATVNFDHTTEELSQRFLDRSWVVTLDPRDLELDGENFVDAWDFSNQPAFSYAKLQEVFGPKPGANVPASQNPKLKEVMRVCSDNGYAVSPRSQKMIRSYVATAASLMDTSSADSTYAPVDYAVSQKILPLIFGPADRVEALVKGLHAIDKLPLTKARLERMIEIGSASGFYQYFA